MAFIEDSVFLRAAGRWHRAMAGSLTTSIMAKIAENSILTLVTSFVSLWSTFEHVMMLMKDDYV